MELILVRHALPQRIERDDGKPADPQLSDEGRRQAERLAEWLGAEPYDAVYASPLRRARETAQPLATTRGLSVQIEPGVIEFDPASDSYIPMEELKSGDYQRWQQLVAGGILDGVDVDRFRVTVVTSLEALIGAHRGQRIVVVCHGGVINTWTAHVLGMEKTLFFDPTYTGISRFLAASSGERSVASLNEVAHLRPVIVAKA
jgi:probable phosphoglycerate mutase